MSYGSDHNHQRNLATMNGNTMSCGIVMGVLQRGLGGSWLTQKFGWVGHNVFGPHQ